jgi:hypothetical protein
MLLRRLEVERMVDRVARASFHHPPCDARGVGRLLSPRGGVAGEPARGGAGVHGGDARVRRDASPVGGDRRRHAVTGQLEPRDGGPGLDLGAVLGREVAHRAREGRDAAERIPDPRGREEMRDHHGNGGGAAGVEPEEPRAMAEEPPQLRCPHVRVEQAGERATADEGHDVAQARVPSEQEAQEVSGALHVAARVVVRAQARGARAEGEHAVPVLARGRSQRLERAGHRTGIGMQREDRPARERRHERRVQAHQRQGLRERHAAAREELAEGLEVGEDRRPQVHARARGVDGARLAADLGGGLEDAHGVAARGEGGGGAEAGEAGADDQHVHRAPLARRASARAAAPSADRRRGPRAKAKATVARKRSTVAGRPGAR